jgi:hypothetical protein
MITMRRQLLGLGLVAASSLFAFHAANALTGPTSIQIDGGPLGPLQLSGGVDGYGYQLAPVPGGDLTNGAEVGSALIELQKTGSELGFTIEVGSNGGTTALGTNPGPTSINTFSTGALYAGYVTFSPPMVSGLTLSAGQIGSLEGWESGVDWNNANQLTTEIFYVQNSQSRGVEAAYSAGPFAATVAFGDGYDNGVFNYLQFLLTDTINSTNSASLYGGVNLGTTGPYTTSYGGDSPIYANSSLYGAFYSYTLGNLNLVPEIQFQYTKAIAKIGLSKPATNGGAAVFADYSFGTSPYSVGAWVEYWDSHTAASTYSQYTYDDEDYTYYSENSPNNFNAFIGPNSEGIGLSVSPTWQYKDLFARADVGALYLLHNSDANTFNANPNTPGAKYGYGSSFDGRFFFTGTLEAGLLF